jgi:thiamine monophosphate synthase
MPYTSDDLAAIDKAIKTGASEVQFRDRKTTYRSLDEMLQIRKLIADDVAAADGQAPTRVTVLSMANDC